MSHAFKQTVEMKTKAYSWKQYEE